jgi:predicted TIM-barrel fold metal-dependent hydrolase
MQSRQSPAGQGCESVVALLTELWEAEVLPVLPGAGLFDVHTHMGKDADGASQDAGMLTQAMDEASVTRAFVFPFRAPAPRDYRALNDSILHACEANPQLVPFCRVEMTPNFDVELDRAIDAGARGIKLHPGTGSFQLSDPGVLRVFDIARDSQVPVLIHGGRGVEDILTLLLSTREHLQPQVIIAHGAIADLARVAPHLRNLPNVALDCSVWHSVDVNAAIHAASPQQIMLGSDCPYYAPRIAVTKLVLALRAAHATDDQLTWALRENAERAARGLAARELDEPLRPPVLGINQLRAHEYLLMATPLIWTRQADMLDLVPLARRALAVEPESKWLAWADRLLQAAEHAWQTELVDGGKHEVLALSWLTFQLVYIADALICGQ